jgi:hypothetical protein
MLISDVFNKVFIIRTIVISGRVINTLLIRNTQGDGVTQDYLKILVFENRAVCEIMWKNIVQPNRPQITL